MSLRGSVSLACLSFGVGCLVFTAHSSRAAGLPPNGELKVAYRQLDAGKLADSVHHLSLWCSDGRCSLTTLSLNQCVFDAFYPKVQRTSTEERNLAVVEIDDGVLEAEERYSGTTFKYRFTYTVRSDPRLSKELGLQGIRWFGELSGFSGAVVKYSAILDKIISWELVPLKGRNPKIEAKCKILLDGVPE
jgi:hypothetical protein